MRNHELFVSEGETVHISVRKPVVQPLSYERWNALAVAEQRLYKDEHGCNAYTDVMPREESNPMLNAMWSYAETGADSTCDNDDPHQIRRETARRVAAAIAVLAFGKEFLLK